MTSVAIAEAPMLSMLGEVQVRAPATYADLEAVPPPAKAELIGDVLYVQSRPRSRHQQVIGAVMDELRGPYHLGRRGPGGWWILPEPGIEVPGSREFSPDLAGWRRTRLADLPELGALTLAPDWLCEILSPGTRRYDLSVKRSFYARIGVNFIWYVDLPTRTLTISQLHEGRWMELGIHSDDDKVRAEPFAHTELHLADWWG